MNWSQQLTICRLDPGFPIAWGFQWRKEFTTKRVLRQASWAAHSFYLTPTCFPGLPSFSRQSWTLCFFWKISALQIRAGGPRFRRLSRSRERRRPTSPSPFWMPMETPCAQLGLFWRARKELVSSILWEQLSHDCHIKMIQAEWYFMIYGIKPPVPEKAWY